VPQCKKDNVNIVTLGTAMSAPADAGLKSRSQKLMGYSVKCAERKNTSQIYCSLLMKMV
jgi:hypothetical protein